MFCICKIQLIYWKEGKGGRTDRRGNEEILHKRGVLGKKIQGGAWRKISCPVFLDFFTSFIFSRILDVYFSWEELCTMGVSCKAICKKRDKIFKKFHTKNSKFINYQ